jgi:hypothetical protein
VEGATGSGQDGQQHDQAHGVVIGTSGIPACILATP